ncbi:putative phosphatase PhoE [Heyndrickxia sporothermodurans]|nr:putative phosphatase PhoE [Heyndrickxia sporothermodurans]
MTRIGFIRHGSTAWNKERRAQGNTDIPLDEEGLLQASMLAARLSNEEWDVIYSSDLLRAKQTADIIGEKLQNIPIHYEMRLREASGGQIEGTTEKERIEKWGPNWRELDLGIEKADNVVKRGIPIFEEISKKHDSKNILIVSHGAFITHLLKELVPHLAQKESLNNTSLTKLIKENQGWECELFNCTRHLDKR